MAAKNGFTWDYVRNQPIAPRPAPYIPQSITPCAVRTAKAAEFAPVGTFQGKTETWTQEVMA